MNWALINVSNIRHCSLTTLIINKHYPSLVQVNVFRLFYLLGAGGTMILGPLLSALSFVSAESAYIVLAGCGSSVFFYVSISMNNFGFRNETSHYYTLYTTCMNNQRTTSPL